MSYIPGNAILQQLPARSPAPDAIHLDSEHGGGAVVRHRR